MEMVILQEFVVLLFIQVDYLKPINCICDHLMFLHIQLMGAYMANNMDDFSHFSSKWTFLTSL